MLKDDPGCKFFKNVNKLYSMQSSHFLMVGHFIHGNLVLRMLDLLLSPCTLCNSYAIHLLLLAKFTSAASSAQECDTNLAGIAEAFLHNIPEIRRMALLLSAGA